MTDDQWSESNDDEEIMGARSGDELHHEDQADQFARAELENGD